MAPITSEDIYEAFRRYLVKQLRFYDSDTLHVGEVSQCLRKSWYTRRYGDKQLKHIGKTKRVILGLGLSTHYVLEEVLREMGYSTEKQLFKQIVYKGEMLKIAGTPDASSKNHVIELKTCKKIPQQPYDSHVMQLNTYLWMTNCDVGYLVYICKVTGEVKVFDITFSYNRLHEFLERALTLKHHLKSKQPPPPERTGMCTFCEWKMLCYGEQKNDSSSGND